MTSELVAATIVAFLLGPATLWAVNTLFSLGIPYTLATISASAFLYLFYHPRWDARR